MEASDNFIDIIMIPRARRRGEDITYRHRCRGSIYIYYQHLTFGLFHDRFIDISSK